MNRRLSGYMNRHVSQVALALVGLALALLASGCAEPLKQYNPKMGLLDVLVQLEPENHSGADVAAYRRSNSYGGHGAVAAFPIPPRGQSPSPARWVSPRRFADVSLEWPLKRVQVTSPFGRRGREFHEGIDLRARPGTAVYSAHAGQVLYAGDRIRGYGEMIVLRHSSGLATIYAHNSRLVVHRGEWVRQGEVIAYTGNTGHSHGPHLHFEVREGVNAVNPLALLPRLGGRTLALR